MANLTCSIEGCDKPRHARGYCRNCYRRETGRLKHVPDWSVLPGEEWRPIPRYEGRYSVSSLGRVRAEPGDGRLPGVKKLTVGQHGYRKVNLYTRPRGRILQVHRLVALAFFGECPDGMEVRHLDGNPANNQVDNLRYGTSSENHHDIVRHGNHHAARRTHCLNGHEFTPENTVAREHGRRRCLECKRRSGRERAARLRRA